MHLSHFPLIFFLKKLFVLVCDGFPYHKLCVFAHRYLLPSPSWWTALATIHLETWQRLSTRHQPGTLHQLSSTNPPPCTLLYPVIWVVSSSEKSKYQYRYQLYLVYLVQVQYTESPSWTWFVTIYRPFHPTWTSVLSTLCSLPSIVGVCHFCFHPEPPRPLPPPHLLPVPCHPACPSFIFLRCHSISSPALTPLWFSA